MVSLLRTGGRKSAVGGQELSEAGFTGFVGFAGLGSCLNCDSC